MLERYIDDVNTVTEAVQPGTEYIDGQLVINPEKTKTDAKRPIDLVTMEVIRDIANDVDDMIKFTVDVPSNHPDKKMPVLDLQVWLEGKQIKYIFYEKPMKSSKVIEKKSALPYTMKMGALTQEAFWRIHNTKKGVF